MAGLLNSRSQPWDALAEQLRAQAPGENWDASGVDRADELAKMLWDKGVRDLSQMSLKTGIGYDAGGTGQAAGSGSGDAEWSQAYVAPEPDLRTDGQALDFGNGLTIGNLGDRGKGGDNGAFLGMSDKGGLGELGWSSAGHGNVGYIVQVGPDGKPQIVPKWGSSSDASDARTIAMGLAAVGGAAYLGGAFAGAGAGATGAGAAGFNAAVDSQLASAAMGAGGAGGGAAATGGGLLANGGLLGFGGAAAPGASLAAGGEALTAAAPEVSFGAGTALNPYGMTGGLVESAAADAALTTGTYGGTSALGANVFGDALAGGGAASAGLGDIISGGIKWAGKNLLEPLGLTGRDALTLVAGGMNNAARASAQADQNAFTATEAQKNRDQQLTLSDRNTDNTIRANQATWDKDAQLLADKFKRMAPTGGLLKPYLQRNP